MEPDSGWESRAVCFHLLPSAAQFAGQAWRSAQGSCAKSALDYNICAILELQQEFGVAQTWRADFALVTERQA